jgi:hypothetical protein
MTRYFIIGAASACEIQSVVRSRVVRAQLRYDLRKLKGHGLLEIAGFALNAEFAWGSG